MPAGLVDEVVVAAAAQYQVAWFGGAAVFPVVDVVGFAPFGGSVAITEPAVLIPGHESVEEVGGDRVEVGPGSVREALDRALDRRVDASQEQRSSRRSI